MVKKQFTVIAYDISNNKRRKKVSDMLEGYGDRMNYSVFECMLKKTDLKRIKERAIKIIDIKTDSLLFYEICSSCTEKTERMGNISKEHEQIIKV